MRINRTQIKDLARENIRGSRPSALLVTLVYLLLTTCIQWVVNLVTNPMDLNVDYEELTWLVERSEGDMEVVLRYLEDSFQLPLVAIFLSVLVSLFTMVMEFGYLRYGLSLAQGREAGYGSLAEGFPYTGRVLGMNLLVALFSFLWAMLVLVPGTLLAVALAVAVDDLAVAMTLIVVIVVLLMVVIVAITLRYSQAGLALAEDPELGALGAIRRSKELMRGRIGEFFVLGLSFIGWYILGGVLTSVLTAVLLGLDLSSQAASVIASAIALPFTMWLTAYVSLTDTHFYLAISRPMPGNGGMN